MFRGRHFIGLIVSLNMAIYGCNQNELKEEFKPVIPSGTEILHLKDTIISLDHEGKAIEIAILRTDKKKKGTVLALPGWNYPYSHWCDSTDLCLITKKKGYDLVLPTMGKTIYSDSIYPQTRKDWKGEVTRHWINKVMIPQLQRDFDVLLEGESNKIIGISTGGRGALLLAIDQPSLFDAGASLSGDFDMSSFPGDNLYNGFFGSFHAHKQLWTGIENPINLISRLKTRFYFAHGSDDSIVSPKHLYVLSEKMDTIKNVILIAPDEGHDYKFWREQTKKAFDFFEY